MEVYSTAALVLSPRPILGHHYRRLHTVMLVRQYLPYPYRVVSILLLIYFFTAVI